MPVCPLSVGIHTLSLALNPLHNLNPNLNLSLLRLRRGRRDVEQEGDMPDSCDLVTLSPCHPLAGFPEHDGAVRCLSVMRPRSSGDRAAVS